MAGPIAGQAGGISNNVSGTASATSGASTLLIAAGNPAQRVFVTGYSLSNTSAVTIYVSFQDGNGGTTLWNQIIPAGGGAIMPAGTTALFWTSPGNALYFAVSTGESTIYANAAGFLGNN